MPKQSNGNVLYFRWFVSSEVNNSTGLMFFLRMSGQFGPPVFIFYWPNGPLVSTIELFNIVLDSGHQLSLPTQQLNTICDSRIHGHELSVEISHHLIYKLQVLHNCARCRCWQCEMETSKHRIFWHTSCVFKIKTDITIDRGSFCYRKKVT